MISVIVGTNRENNVTKRVAELVDEILSEKLKNHDVLHLENLPGNFIFNNIYTGKMSKELEETAHRYVASADKFIFLIPEYNGSFPGVLKAFVDSVDPALFKNKKALLIGLSAGRAGNVRGLDHFTGVLHYLKTTVYPFKFAIPGVENQISDENQKNVLKQKLSELVEDFLNF